jgi:virginiamycin B lyase
MLVASLLAATMPVLPAWAERGDITEFDLPEGSRMQPLVAGPDGNLWLAGTPGQQPFSVAVIRLTPDGEVTTFGGPRVSGEEPVDITLGPDGNLWVVEFEYRQVLRVTPEGEFTVYRVRGLPISIASGPDGNLWVAASNLIARITIDGDMTESPLPPGLWAEGITAGPDDRMWFSGGERRIGMIAMDGTIEELEIAVQPGRSIALGSDGNLWFPAVGADGRLIVRLTPDGELTKFPVPNQVEKIVAGPDGALWGTQPEVQQIVRITTEGEIEEFALPSRPLGFAAGPDGNMWYTTWYPTLGYRVGRLEVGSVPAAVRSVERFRR